MPQVHQAGLSALCEFRHHSISRLQRMSTMTGRTAAWCLGGQGPVWAVHVGRGEIVWQDRSDAANGSKEPIRAIEWLSQFGQLRK